MSVFNRGLLVSEHDQRDTEQLGDNTGQFKGVDVGKAMVYNGIQMDLAASTNDIVGFLETVEAYTNNGHNIGTVKKSGRVRVEVVGTTLAVGDFVFAAAQTALGTAGNGLVSVDIAPGNFKWVVVWLDTDGTAGTTVVIEKV